MIVLENVAVSDKRSPDDLVSSCSITAVERMNFILSVACPEKDFNMCRRIVRTGAASLMH
jgi:hypothetical protein